jgi:hypothetical protein
MLCVFVVNHLRTRNAYRLMHSIIHVPATTLRVGFFFFLGFETIETFCSLTPRTLLLMNYSSLSLIVLSWQAAKR